MRPSDPRLRSRLAVARRPLTGVVAGGVVSSLLVIGQAFAVAALVVALVDGRALLVPAATVAGAFLARAAVGAFTDLAAVRAANAVTTSMRADITSAVLAGRTGSLSEGELAALATRGVAAAEPYLTRYVPALVLASVLPVLAVVAVATQDVLSGVIVLATLPLVPVFGALVGLATRDRAASQWRAMASLSGHFVDVMRGLPTLVAFRRARAQVSTIRAVTDRYRRASVATLRIAFASAAVLELVATLSVALVAVVVGVRLAGGGLDLRTGLVVLLLAPEAYWPLRRVGAEFHAAAEGAATFEVLSELTAPIAPAAETAPGRHGALVACGVTFSYPGRRTPAVRDLDLVIAPASLTVLAGPSGCGKSTVLALLAGLLRPEEGVVDAAGTTASSRAWQSQVAWIPQRPVFLAGSVADNLRLGAPWASDAELHAVLARVVLSERVELLGGLDGAVGEDARLLSAGERARLALARAVVSGRPWMLLDEPTAHLDPLTRKILLDVLIEESRHRGVVVVAHDPETIAAADQLVELPAAEAATLPGIPAPAPPAARPAEDIAPGPAAKARFGLSTVLGALSSLSGVALTATAGWLIVEASHRPPVLTMLVAIVGVRTFGLGRPVLRYVERLRSHDAALRLLADRRVAIYEALVPLTPGRLGKRRGDVLASVVDDVDATVDGVLRVRLPLRGYALVLAVATAVGCLIWPVAGLTLGGVCALGAGAGYAVVRWGCADPERDLVATRAELSATVLDAAQLATDLRMWQAEESVLGEVGRLGDLLGRAGRRSARALAAGRGAVLVSAGLGVVAVAAVVARPVTDATLTAPLAALLVLMPLALGDVAAGVVEAAAVAGRVRSAERRLASYAALPPAVTEPTEAVATPSGTGVQGDGLALGWVTRPVLSDLDLRVGAGELVAVIGPSGSGKSTLAATLVRFLDPLGGSVSLGGAALDTLALDAVRERIGLLDDDPHVFASTLAENVRLARPGATDAEVLDALRAARLEGWVAGLPDGLGTWLGDGHAHVSGGERARIGLARSVLADQPVLVLDEPIAHLDRGTAHELAADLLDGAAGRSVVWITHSDIGLERMDRIVELG